MMTSFKELSDSDYTRLRKKLLRERGSDRQREFLTVVRHTEDFLKWLSSVPTVGSTDAAILHNPLTESEFKDPPPDAEQMLYTAWAAVTPAVACRSTFWAHVTLEHIRKGRIESVYLAANGGNLPGGAERIDFALHDKTTKAPQAIDACVRTVLRRLGGLPEVRGNRSVYVDCPFARAWWRERMVEQTSNGDQELAAHVRSVIRIHQTYWEKVVDRIVFRNSTFGSSNIRNAFMRALAQFVQSHPETEMAKTDGLQRLCRRASAYQGNRELSILSDNELDALMGTIVSAA